jgi:hypothetical protein
MAFVKLSAGCELKFFIIEMNLMLRKIKQTPYQNIFIHCQELYACFVFCGANDIVRNCLRVNVKFERHTSTETIAN